jgi:hypothetical protein
MCEMMFMSAQYVWTCEKMNAYRHDNTISLYFISKYGYQRINKIFNPVVDFSGRKCKIGHSADVEYHFRLYNLILVPFVVLRIMTLLIPD